MIRLILAEYLAWTKTQDTNLTPRSKTMAAEPVGAEDVLTGRVKDKLTQAAPGFDPAIIATLMGLFTDLLASCAGPATQLTPEQAVAQISKMTPLRRSMFKSQLKKRAREDGVKEANKIAPLAVDAVTQVAQEATPSERVAFAAHVLPIANSDFTMI